MQELELRMSELRDCFIKLFGQMIAFSNTREQEHDNYIKQQQNQEPSKDDPKIPSQDVEASSMKISDNRAIKKPDKVVPCPRCKSMDTKFCYYNNYNINQPRHLCQKCQRYWTAGGSMRKLPVGAGRRKSKNPTTLHYHHITVSEALQLARMSDGVVWGCDVSGSRNSSCVSPPDSRVLGKRLRGGKVLGSGEEESFTSERSVWIPESLRIDDSSEVAKSSMWLTGLFKSFQSDGDRKNQFVFGSAAALQINPAAMTRSCNFHENA